MEHSYMPAVKTFGLVEKKIMKTKSLFLLEEDGSVNDCVGALHSLNYTTSALNGRNSTTFHLQVPEVAGSVKHEA
jgi:hypothetical protein